MNDRYRCTDVRSFKINEHRLYLYINLETDGTFVTDRKNNEIGLAFSSGTDITYKGKRIGRIRMSFDDTKNLRFLFDKEDGTEENIDTGVNQELVECYLDAEVFITKHLIETGFIKLEAQNG